MKEEENKTNLKAYFLKRSDIRPRSEKKQTYSAALQIQLV